MREGDGGRRGKEEKIWDGRPGTSRGGGRDKKGEEGEGGMKEKIEEVEGE